MTLRSRRGQGQQPPRELPVDEEDYLVPSPQSPHVPTPTNNNVNVNPYMDLIDPNSPSARSNKGSSSGNAAVRSQSSTMFPYPPPQGYFLTGNASWARLF